MAFGINSPKDYTDANSYAFKRWFNSVYAFLTTITSLTTVTTTYTVDSSIFYVRADATTGAFTVTLPPALNTQGRRVLVKKVDSSVNAVTVSRMGSDTIEGSTTKSLSSQWSHIQVISNGVNGWEII